MKSYRTYSTVTSSKQIVISGLPFGNGEMVEIVVRPANGKGSQKLNSLKDLFKQTQSLPQVQTLTEAELIREIDDFRKGK